MIKIRELAKELNIPRDWLSYHVALRGKSVEDAIALFKNPGASLRTCHKTHPNPLGHREMVEMVEKNYDLPLSDLLVLWASYGYRRTRVAYWLKTKPQVISNYLNKAGVKIKWKDAPEIDKRGKAKAYHLHGKPITITEFARQYHKQAASLSSRWKHLTPDEVSEEMEKMADASSPMRRFLLGRTG